MTNKKRSLRTSLEKTNWYIDILNQFTAQNNLRNRHKASLLIGGARLIRKAWQEKKGGCLICKSWTSLSYSVEGGRYICKIPITSILLLISLFSHWFFRSQKKRETNFKIIYFSICNLNLNLNVKKCLLREKVTFVISYINF